MSRPPFSELIRLNQIGTGLDRRIEPDPAARDRIRQALDLARLEALTADLKLVPAGLGWRLSGRLHAEAVQTCGLTLEPLPVTIDQSFSVAMVEGVAEPDDGEGEIDIVLDDNSPDVIEGGAIDLGVYVVEQLALNLDPFPRKPGATFVQPDEPVEISPFAVLRRIGPKAADEEG